MAETIFSNDLKSAFGFGEKTKGDRLRFGTVVSASTTVHKVALDCANGTLTCKAGCDATQGDMVVVLIPECGHPCTLCQLTSHKVRT